MSTGTIPIASAARFLHASNLLTYLSLLAGLGAIAAARGAGGAPAVGALLALAVVADTFDGRFARLFARSDTQRSFGVQLDSLSDALTFGLAPVVALGLLLPPLPTGAQAAWWGAGFVYVVGAVTRLGFYNLVHEDAAGFIGLPTPVAALVWSSLLLAPLTPAVSAAALVACGALMVSPLRIPRPRGVWLVAFAAWALSLAALHAAALVAR
ncbi:MAG: CDP-alcohol phosphatidyltransferase family protein [Gemmatimonadetes bacterium]|nr:CDP-alcohol phosphatidyltransferase family protein [Gemmatimonadota bacterium]MBI4543166.1 CDP-alcohol phosphatidyltransferase family protein [Gemmatimonadota bacterium]